MDTPGFGDSDNDDEALVEEMMNILANVVVHADTIVLLFKGTETRFNASLQSMLKIMTQIFGVDWWNYVVIGVSFWPYDQDSIDDRVCDPEYPDFCQDEAWFCKEINTQLRDKLHVDKNFTCVFTDSFSQTGDNVEDPLQQEHWTTETGLLWEITTSREDTFGFLTIDDILEENTRMRAEIKWLNDVITNNISELAAQMERNNAAIAANELSIEDNVDNLGLVSGRVTTNEAHIATTNLRIDENTANDNALEAYFTSALHPVGKNPAYSIRLLLQQFFEVLESQSSMFIPHNVSCSTLPTDPITKVQSLPGWARTGRQLNSLSVGSFVTAPTSTGDPWKVHSWR